MAIPLPCAARMFISLGSRLRSKSVPNWITRRNIANMSAADFKKLSKVELHVHLDGAMRASTIFEIAKKRGIKLPQETADALAKECSISIDAGKSLTDFLSKFDIFMPVVAGDVDAIKRVAYEWCEDASNDNIIYSEVRYCPHFLANSLDGNAFSGEKGDLTPEKVVELVNAGLEQGCKDFNVKVRTLLCCMRHEPSWSKDMLDLCVKFREKWVVGIDLAGDENLNLVDPTQKQHCEVFQKAAKLGISRTVHAGENGTAANVHEALDHLCAMRIGHGYHAVDDNAVYQRCLEEGIHFEVCPVSSLLTGSVSHDPHLHPVKRFAADNANFSLNTDDPLVTGTELSDELVFVTSRVGLTQQDVLKANLNAARSSFLPAAEKKELVDHLTKEYQVKFGINFAEK